MVETIGFSYTLAEGESILIKETKPAEIIARSSDDLFAIAGMAGVKEPTKKDRIFALPFLTDQRIILWCLVITEKHGVLSNWFHLPFDYIHDVKYGKGKLEIIYKVPKLKKGAVRKLLGLGRKKEEIRFTIGAENSALWKMHLTKILLGKTVETGKGITEKVVEAVKKKKICPTCETENPNDASFCLSCGAKIGIAKCPACGRESPAGAKICPYCGKRL